MFCIDKEKESEKIDVREDASRMLAKKSVGVDAVDRSSSDSKVVTYSHFLPQITYRQKDVDTAIEDVGQAVKQADQDASQEKGFADEGKNAATRNVPGKNTSEEEDSANNSEAESNGGSKSNITAKADLKENKQMSPQSKTKVKLLCTGIITKYKSQPQIDEDHGKPSEKGGGATEGAVDGKTEKKGEAEKKDETEKGEISQDSDKQNERRKELTENKEGSQSSSRDKMDAATAENPSKDVKPADVDSSQAIETKVREGDSSRLQGEKSKRDDVKEGSENKQDTESSTPPSKKRKVVDSELET